MAHYNLNEYVIACFVELYESDWEDDEVSIECLRSVQTPADVRSFIEDMVLMNMEDHHDILKHVIMNTIDIDYVWEEIWKNEDIHDHHKDAVIPGWRNIGAEPDYESKRAEIVDEINAVKQSIKSD